MPVVVPAGIGQLDGNADQLFGKAGARGDGKDFLQPLRHSLPVLVTVFPLADRHRVRSRAGVAHIEHIGQRRLAVLLSEQGNPHRTGPHIPAHTFLPEVVPGTGRGPGALGMDHNLVLERILVVSCGGAKKCGPMGGVAGDLRNSAVGQIGIVLGLCAHGGCSSFINNFAAGFATAPVHPDRMPHEGKPKKIAPTAKTVEVIVFLLLSAVDTDLTLTLIVPVLEALM